MNLQQIACILKVGFLLKYFNKEQIAHWAHKKIFEDNENLAIIELSLVENKSNNEILTLIGTLIGNLDSCEKNILDEYFLGYYKELLLLNKHKDLWINIEKEVLRYYSISNFDLSEEEKLFSSILNNDFSLRQEGLSGVMKMPDALVSFLSPYNKFHELQKKLDIEGFPLPDSSASI